MGEFAEKNEITIKIANGKEIKLSKDFVTFDVVEKI
jgi:hypothetical protein